MNRFAGRRRQASCMRPERALPEGAMPEPLTRGQRYMPGLDGLRALAVAAVVLYHLGFGWAGGGLLGVGVFFTLSGYLITDILLAQIAGRGIRLGRFWLGRARRLLPALLSMLAIVSLWVAIVGPAQHRVRRGRGGGSALCQQLAADLPARLVLRALRASDAAEPSLVARDRGAVLHLLAAPAPPRRAPRPGALTRRRHPTSARVADAAARGGLGGRDGDPLPPELRQLAHLLRHRHARIRAARRSRARDGVAEPPPAGEHHDRRAARLRRARA